MLRAIYQNGEIRLVQMSPAEITELEKMSEETMMPTPEERIAALEWLTDDIVLFMAELIGG